MQTIGSFWWLWLVLFIASFSCAMVVAFKGGLKITFGLLDLILSIASGRSGREEVLSKQPMVGSVEDPGTSEEGDGPSEIEKSSSNEGDSKKGSVIGNLILLVVTGISALVTSLLFALSIIVNLIRLATGH